MAKRRKRERRGGTSLKNSSCLPDIHTTPHTHHPQPPEGPWVSECLFLGSFLSQVTFAGRLRFKEGKSQTPTAPPPLYQPQDRQENFPFKPHRLTLPFQSQFPLHSALTDPKEWIPSPPLIQALIPSLPLSLFVSKAVLWVGMGEPGHLGWGGQVMMPPKAGIAQPWPDPAGN